MAAPPTCARYHPRVPRLLISATTPAARSCCWRSSSTASSTASGWAACSGWHPKSARPSRRRPASNYRRARIQVFMISSVALGFIGGFYATHFRGASPNLFTFDTMLLSLAMLVIGGIGRAEGAVVGTLIVVFIDRVLIDLGPLRLMLIGRSCCWRRALPARRHLRHQDQFRAWRDKKKSEAPPTRAEKGGEMLPEEAAEAMQQGPGLLPPLRQDAAGFSEDADHAGDHRGVHGEPARPAQRGAGAGAQLFPPPAADRQIRDHGGRAVQGLPDRRALGRARRRAPPRRGQDLSLDRGSLHGLFMRRVQDLLEA